MGDNVQTLFGIASFLARTTVIAFMIAAIATGETLPITCVVVSITLVWVVKRMVDAVFYPG